MEFLAAECGGDETIATYFKVYAELCTMSIYASSFLSAQDFKDKQLKLF